MIKFIDLQDMHRQKNILAFIGDNYNSQIDQIEHYLPLHLSRYYNVTVFEFPRINRTLTLLAKRNKLIENLNQRLTVFHSFAVFPFGKTFILFNLLNHLLNYWLLTYLLKEKYDLIISLTPEAAFLPNPGRIPLIYHVLDEYGALPWWNNFFARKQLKFLEKEAVARCRKIIVVSEKLKEKFIASKKRISLFPTPVEIEQFFVRGITEIPDDLRKLPKPIIGFAGSITFKNKIWEELLEELMKTIPDASLVLIGIIRDEVFNIRHYVGKYPNFYYLGLKKKEEIPQYIKRFNLGIIPYKLNSYGQAAYPVKVMEYLSCGIPVVASDMPSLSELKKKKLIYTAKTSQEFVKNCQIAINENSLILRQKRINLAKLYSWPIQIKNYLKLIEIKSYAKT